MAELVRFGVSMDAELLSAFDHLIERKGYDNRSEAIRDLVREAIVHTRWQRGRSTAVGALCIVYDHKAHDLVRKLTRLQHEHVTQVISTMHVHLNEADCFEVMVMRGPAAEIQALADTVIATRGVRHGRLVMTAGTDTRRQADGGT
ncbi:MAG: nickel-responsive transcriptional regulator NikR [Phycisphaerales bacterium]|nr:MAG: nickel-responsive transcriptional regulator NikR [Phycisphaerales bacterium]